LEITPEEMKKRFEESKPPERKVVKGFLAIYSRIAQSADHGGVFA
jgi:dihydroxyacid dehydratase/phosphogluconate dehydratase